MPAPRGNSGLSLGHVSGEVRVYPADGAAAGRGIFLKMSFSISSEEDLEYRVTAESSGPIVDIATGDDAVSGPEDVSWLPLPTTGFADSMVPKAGPREFYLAYRYQWKQGVVADVWDPREPHDPDDPFHPELCTSFRAEGPRHGNEKVPPPCDAHWWPFRKGHLSGYRPGCLADREE